MASMTMTATFLAGPTLAKSAITTRTRGLIVAKASSGASEGERVNLEMVNKKEESSSGRRDMVFAAAAFAAYSVAKVAFADEPKRGTSEAKKKYAPICVTMPTARICHK